MLVLWLTGELELCGSTNVELEFQKRKYTQTLPNPWSKVRHATLQSYSLMVKETYPAKRNNLLVVSHRGPIQIKSISL